MGLTSFDWIRSNISTGGDQRVQDKIGFHREKRWFSASNFYVCVDLKVPGTCKAEVSI